MTKPNDTDLNATHYRKHSKLQTGLAQELLRDLKFDSAAKVLDVGCGDGRITAEIAQQVLKGRVIGIDASSSMIELGKATYPASDFKNLHFQLAKAEEFSHPEQFDAVVSFSCFHWIRQPQRALKRLCDALVPGGKLVILTYPGESTYYEFMQEALESFKDYQGLSAYHTMLPIKEYKEILEAGGIQIEEFKVREIFASYQDKKAIKDYIKGWLTSYVPLPEHLHDEYLDKVVENSMKYAVDLNNGMINLPYKALTIKGKKSEE